MSKSRATRYIFYHAYIFRTLSPSISNIYLPGEGWLNTPAICPQRHSKTTVQTWVPQSTFLLQLYENNKSSESGKGNQRYLNLLHFWHRFYNRFITTFLKSCKNELNDLKIISISGAVVKLRDEYREIQLLLSPCGIQHTVKSPQDTWESEGRWSCRKGNKCELIFLAVSVRFFFFPPTLTSAHHLSVSLCPRQPPLLPCYYTTPVTVQGSLNHSGGI